MKNKVILMDLLLLYMNYLQPVSVSCYCILVTETGLKWLIIAELWYVTQLPSAA